MTESINDRYHELVGTRKLSWEEYARIPYDGLGHHLINGVHIITPAPSTNHQEISNKLSYYLTKFALDNKCGKVFTAPVDVKLSEKDGFQPDVIFIRGSRLDIVKDQYIAGSPDLVVEILSPESDKADFGWKKDLVDKYEVSEYWVIDPFQQQLHQFIRKEGDLVLLDIFNINQNISPKIQELDQLRVALDHILS